MPGDLTTDTIEKRGDSYVLLSAEGEVLGEFDTQVKSAEGAESFDSLLAEAIKAGSLPESARELIKSGEMKRVIIGPHDYSQATTDSGDWVDTVDFAPFSKVDSRDANGFMRVSATVTKPGVYAYMRDGKIRHELKPESEIFAPVHMESVHGAVVTSEHPPGAVAVTPENSKKFQRGHSMSAPTRTADGLDVELVVTDQTLIDDAESGRRTGVSEGMRNTFDHTPGIWTAPDGSKHPYDVIQTNMVANHLAIVSTPRVTAAQLHLDSLEQDETEDTNMANKATLSFDGYDFETEPAIASVVKAQLGRRDDEIKALQVKLSEATTSYDSLTEEKDKLTAERDTAHAERDTLKEKLTVADSVDIAKLVTDRIAFTERAQSVMTADSFDEVKGKTDLEIMSAACEKAKLVMTEDSDAYLRARFDGLVDQVSTTNDSKLLKSSLTMPPVSPTRVSEQTEINKQLSEIYTSH